MSRYVEITKDGNNYNVNPNAVPSGGSVTLYAWHIGNSEVPIYMDFDVAPADYDAFNSTKSIYILDNEIRVEPNQAIVYIRVDDSTFQLSDYSPKPQPTTYNRYAAKDVVIWN